MALLAFVDTGAHRCCHRGQRARLRRARYGSLAIATIAVRPTMTARRSGWGVDTIAMISP